MIQRIQTTWEADERVSWPCRCGKSHITINQKSLHSEETAESREAFHHENWTPEWIQMRFVALATCNSCHESSTIAGRAVNVPVLYKTLDDEYHSKFTAYHFSPPPQVIPRHEAMSSKLDTQLTKAEALILTDEFASANALRTALEFFMDDQGVSRHRFVPKNKNQTAGPKKKVRLDLHARIEMFGKQHPELRDHLLAAKWLGNDGTHAKGELTVDDLYEAFAQIDHVFEQVFRGTLKRLRKTAAAINKHKGAKGTKRKGL